MKSNSILSKILFSVSCFFILLLTVSGCISEPDYPAAPVISFNQIRKVSLKAGTGVGQGARDSIIITLNFQDGDGDLGVNINDKNLSAILKATPNYEMKTLFKVKGIYKVIDLGDSYSKFFFQPLRTDGKSGPIEGQLDYSTGYYYDFDYGFKSRLKKDTVKFQIFIRDRALNQSNTIESDPIIINE